MLNLFTSLRKLKDKLVRDKPVNLNLFTIAFPVTAIASILHRISGIFLFLIIPFLLNLLNNLKNYPANYSSCEFNFFTKLVIWLGISALIYHLLAGIRHLIMDMGFGEDKSSARVTSFVVIAMSFLMILFVGYRLW